MLNLEDERFNERFLNLGPYKYQGSSVGGERTYHGIQNYKICFDLGTSSLSTTTLNKVFLTHGHADHCGGLIPHLWRRNVRKLPLAEYYAQPEDAIYLQEMVDISCKLSRNSPVRNVLKVMNDEPVILNNKLKVTKFDSVHRIPCTGYLLEEKRVRLNPEYQDLTKQEKHELRQSGISLGQEFWNPEIAFTGDTSIDVFDKNPHLLNTRYLITECTGLDHKMDRDKVRAAGHIHLEDLVEYFQEHEFLGESLILGHFSSRYSVEYCLKMINLRLPSNLLMKTILI